MNKKIILIVDDVQFNHRTANMVLQDTYELYNALSAEEAFNILEKVRPDLILFRCSNAGYGRLRNDKKY